MCLGNRVDYISVFETSKLLLGLLVVDCFNVGEIRCQGEELGFWVVHGYMNGEMKIRNLMGTHSLRVYSVGLNMSEYMNG